MDLGVKTESEDLVLDLGETLRVPATVTGTVTESSTTRDSLQELGRHIDRERDDKQCEETSAEVVRGQADASVPSEVRFVSNKGTFPYQLWTILQEGTSSLLRWHGSGLALILNTFRFDVHVQQEFPSQFGDNKLANFCRQLRTYDFKEVTPKDPNWRQFLHYFVSTPYCRVWYHRFLRRGRPNELSKIVRVKDVIPRGRHKPQVVRSVPVSCGPHLLDIDQGTSSTWKRGSGTSVGDESRIVPDTGTMDGTFNRRKTTWEHRPSGLSDRVSESPAPLQESWPSLPPSSPDGGPSQCPLVLVPCIQSAAGLIPLTGGAPISPHGWRVFNDILENHKRSEIQATLGTKAELHTQSETDNFVDDVPSHYHVLNNNNTSELSDGLRWAQYSCGESEASESRWHHDQLCRPDELSQHAANVIKIEPTCEETIDNTDVDYS